MGCCAYYTAASRLPGLALDNGSACLLLAWHATAIGTNSALVVATRRQLLNS